MKKENSTPSFFDESLKSLLEMRQLAQKNTTSVSIDDFNKSSDDDNNSFVTNNDEFDYEYIPPSPFINIERINTCQNYSCNKSQQKNHRFAFLMQDVDLREYNNNNGSTFRMKYQLPNIQTLQSPTKMYKPISVVSFIKK